MLLCHLSGIEIHAAMAGKWSLRDFMRALYQQHMQEGRGFAYGEVRKRCEEIWGRSSKRFSSDYVDGVDKPPFAEVLAKIGSEAEPLPAKPPARQRPSHRRIQLMAKPPKKGSCNGEE